MKAIHFDAPGNPEVMRIVDVEKPVPGENQVLIKVKAAGVNRPDLIQREGNYPPPNGHSNILGLEVSGEIKSKGRNVKNFKVGDPVCALVNGGGYAEFCVADAGNIINKPKNLNFVEAAAIPECFFTCWSNIFDRGEVKNDQYVLIHGGSSGIGTTAIQMLKIFNIFTFLNFLANLMLLVISGIGSFPASADLPAKIEIITLFFLFIFSKILFVCFAV